MIMVRSAGIPKPRPRRHYGLKCMLFVLPAFVFYTLFCILPDLLTIPISFTSWSGFNLNIEFIGLRNYVNIFTRDPVFFTAIRNNVIFTLVVLIFQTGIALVFAELIHKETRVNNSFRTLFFLPAVISSVSLSFTWSFIYDPNLGGLNMLLGALGLGSLTQVWLGDMSIAIYSIAVVMIWQNMGYSMTIFIAGYQTIPESLTEAARIDGASGWQVYKHVTWPLLARVTTIVTVLTTIGCFKVFDLVYLMTGGGPADATQVLSTVIYTKAFRFNKMGLSAAVSVVLFAIIGLISLVQFGYLSKREVNF